MTNPATKMYAFRLPIDEMNELQKVAEFETQATGERVTVSALIRRGARKVIAESKGKKKK